MAGSTTFTGRARPKTRLLVAAAVIGLVLAGAAWAAPGAQARTNDKAKTVLFVHGYDFWANSQNCGGDFDAMISQLRSQGFTGSMVKVGYYSNDVNCDVNLHSYGTYGNGDSWKQIGKAMSNYVYSEYTSKGIAVDIVGYSMGGLITRGAINGSQKGESGFSAPIDVEDVVTLGTPHNGAAWYTYLCLWGQCSTMRPGSTDLNWLNQNGNPQGRNGTEFTAIASNNDTVTPAASGIYMSIPSSNKVMYSSVPHTGATNYMHDSAVVIRSGDALAYAAQ